MDQQGVAHDWANEQTAEQAAVDAAAVHGSDQPRPKQKWTKPGILGLIAAALAAAGIGYGIGATTNDNDNPPFFDGPGGHSRRDGQFAPDGQRPPRPGDQDLNGNGIEDHHEQNGGDDLSGTDDLAGANA